MTTATTATTAFIRNNFSYHGGYLSYHQSPHVYPNGHQVNDLNSAEFVARFKYNKRSKARFLTFLIKNFTPTEYFSRLKAGETPAGILKSKGYENK